MDSFVDVAYRGLSLGRKVKLTQVRPSSGFVEVPAPMPVGTLLAIATEDGLALEAVVAEVREQTGGSDRVAGMVVRPQLASPSVSRWWSERVSMPDLAKPAQTAVVAESNATVMPKRMTLQGAAAVPELVDDGRNTSVMEVPPELQGGAAEPDAGATLVDDGKRTSAMTAVVLAALGLENAAKDVHARTTMQIPIMDEDEGEGGDDGKPSDSRSGSSSRKKRKRR